MRFDDAMIMNDCLVDQKHIMEEYNRAVMESASNQLRQDFLNIYQDESAIQRDIFQGMVQKGWYTVPEADTQKILQLRNQYTQQLQMVGK